MKKSMKMKHIFLKLAAWLFNLLFLVTIVPFILNLIHFKKTGSGIHYKMLKLELTNKVNWKNYLLFESLYWLIACSPIVIWGIIIAVDSPHLRLISTILIYCVSIILLLTLVLYKVKCNLYGQMNFIERQFDVCLTSTEEDLTELSTEEGTTELPEKSDAETLETELVAIKN